jgi:glycosyltransferase involved in cell wall biosynthesis
VRVAFVINSLGAGGTERSTTVLLPHLRDRGIEPVVLVLAHRAEGDEATVIEAGFAVHVVEPTALVARVRALRGHLGALRPDVVHTAIFEADVAGRLAAIGTGIPVISSLVNTPYDPERLRDPNVSSRKLQAVRAIDGATGRLLTTRFHAVTEGVAEDAVTSLHLPPSRISVVERGRDPQALGRRSAPRRAAVRDRLGWGDDRTLVLAVGRQEHQKGHVHLVRALARLSGGRPEIEVAIAGRSGNATAAIEAAVASTPPEVRDRIHLLGHRDDIPDLLAAADVFAMPSLYEGTAGAAIEAFALEVPVVATTLRGTRGLLIDGENALLVPVGDDRALADAILATLDDPDATATRVKAGRNAFEERFTLERSADAMAALYQDVARGGRRARRRGAS